MPGFLATLGEPLSYPVAIDGGGQVADGYGVQGVPWFVVTTATGKVLWSWQVSVSGWLSTAAFSSTSTPRLAARQLVQASRRAGLSGRVSSNRPRPSLGHRTPLILRRDFDTIDGGTAGLRSFPHAAIGDFTAGDHAGRAPRRGGTAM